MPSTLGILDIHFGAERHQFRITEPSSAIGRAPDNQLVLGDPMVSRYHARLEYVDGRFILVDLGSANGTALNGEPLEPKTPRTLHDGDTILVGEYKMRLHVTGPRTAGSAPSETSIAAPQAILPLALARPRLIIRTAAFAREAALDKDVLTLGSDMANDIVIEDPAVASHHAVLRRTADSYEITDLTQQRGASADGNGGAPKTNTQIATPPALEKRSTPPPPTVGGPLDLRATPLPTTRHALVGVPPHPPESEAAVPHLPETTPPPAAIADSAPAAEPGAPALPEGVVPHLPETAPLPQTTPLSAKPSDSALRRPTPPPHPVPMPLNPLRYLNAPITQKQLADGDVLWIGSEVSLTYRAPAKVPVMPQVDLRGRAQISMGRAASNDVCLPHPAISRQHARLTRRDGAFTLEDLDSSNGTYLNGKRLAPRIGQAIQPGDTLRLGPFKFFVTAEALEQSDESHDLRLDALHLRQPAGNTPPLQDISLSILPREFVAIVGASGAGKSTLLGALVGFRPAKHGAVLVNGTDLYERSAALRSHIGFVPQDDTVHRDLSVSEALDYAARLRLPADTTAEERAQRVDQVVRTLGLGERREMRVGNLNAGQRKRVSIGVELLSKPGLFFLDEATTGLDPSGEGQLMRLLRQLADGGHTIVLVTHATKNVMLCDMVAFMAAGYLAYFGPPAEALDYFGVRDFDTIYEKLQEEMTPERWAERFRQSPQYHAYVMARLADKYGPDFDAPRPPVAPAEAVGGAPPLISARRQFRILSSRTLRLLRRERLQLWLLLLAAPVVGSLDLVAWPRQVLDPRDGDAARSMLMLVMAVISAFVVGALTNVREIVKEAPIYRRERAVTLRVLPYLLSKVWVALLFALYHAAVLLFIKWLVVDLSTLTPFDLFALYITLALAVMSGAVTALLVSALARREEPAILLLVAVFAVQIVFGGSLLTLDQLGGVGKLVRAATSVHWGFQGAVAAAHILDGGCTDASLAGCRLPGIQALASDPERRVLVFTLERQFGDVLHGSLAASWFALFLIGLALFIALVVVQRRKDHWG